MNVFSAVRPVELEFGESFNATTSLVNFGAQPTTGPHYPFAQTMVALVYPNGVGELSTNTILNVTGSADANGPRLRLGDSSGTSITVNFNAHSTGTAAAPLKAGAASVVTYQKPTFVGAAWGGGLLASDIDIFYNQASGNPDVIKEGSPSATTDGTTAAANGSGNSIVIGNRGDAGRTFNGHIYYVARYLGKLSLEQVREILDYGPLIPPFRDVTLMCYANGVDLGPYCLPALTKTAITRVAVRPELRYPLGYLPPRKTYFANSTVAAGGGFFSRYHYDLEHQRAA